MPISSLSGRLAGAAAFVALLVAPAGASAIVVSLDQPCYTHVPTQGTRAIVATITGGTPSANFVLSATDPGKGLGSAGSTSGTFDTAGNAVAQITDVFPPSGSIGPLRGQSVDLSIADYGAGGTQVPVGEAVITNLAIDVSTSPRNPRARRRVRVSGTPFAGKRLYGFVTKPGSSHVLRRFALGKGNACGYASSKQVVAPLTYRTGSYRLYVNAGKRLNRALSLRYAFRISAAAF